MLSLLSFFCSILILMGFVFNYFREEKRFVSRSIISKTIEEVSSKNVLSHLISLGERCASAEFYNLDSKNFLGKDIKLLHINASELRSLESLKPKIEIAKNLGLKISFDLGSEQAVIAQKSEILSFLLMYVDILFANEKEMRELTQLPPIEACDYLSSFCEVVVVTMGFSGSWVKSKDLQFYTPSCKQNQIVNAGVGDLFVSGFLFGYLNHHSIPYCSWIGSFIASKALEKKELNYDRVFWIDVSSSLKKELEENKLR